VLATRAIQVLVLLASLLGAGHASAQAPTAARETAVKAAFLSKFPGFVEWPAPTLAQPDEPVVIGVLGNDAVASDLQEIAAARTGSTRPITVRTLRDASNVAGIHVLFIGAARPERVRDVIGQVHGPVLIVTEQEDGLHLGSMLNFSVDGGRVRFAAAPAAAEAKSLRLSARLLALAQSVEGRR
jgi:hypothetical protein